jgi:hypothetical protein
MKLFLVGDLQKLALIKHGGVTGLRPPSKSSVRAAARRREAPRTRPLLNAHGEAHAVGLATEARGHNKGCCRA